MTDGPAEDEFGWLKLTPRPSGRRSGGREQIAWVVVLALLVVVAAGAVDLHGARTDQRKQVATLNGRIGALEVQVTALTAQLGAAQSSVRGATAASADTKQLLANLLQCLSSSPVFAGNFTDLYCSQIQSAANQAAVLP